MNLAVTTTCISDDGGRACQIAKPKTGICRECGTIFHGKRITREFCCSSCRRAFNNRKAARGAAIYDLAMIWRCARDAEALSLLCRMLTEFKVEDDRDRAGRKSYDPIEKVKASHCHLSSTVVGRNVLGLGKGTNR